MVIYAKKIILIGIFLFKEEGIISLTIRAKRTPSTGSNIIARINEDRAKKL